MEKTINEQIEELTKKKEALEREESKLAWKEWFREGEAFLDNVIGKDFITKLNGGGFVLFRVKSYKKNNWFGNVDYKGFIEVHSEGYFRVYPSNYKYSEPFHIQNKQSDPFGTISLKVNKIKPSKRTILSTIGYDRGDMRDEPLVDISRVVKIGYRGENYDDSKFAFLPKPEKSVKSWLMDIWGWYEAPKGLYERCVALSNLIGKELDSIWTEYEEKISKCNLIK